MLRRMMLVVSLAVVTVGGASTALEPAARAADAKAPPPPVAETLAAKVSAAYGVKVGAKDVDSGGLPAMLVEPIAKRYDKAKDTQAALWRDRVAVFEKAWKAYVARRDEVTAAVAKADEQAKSKKIDDAKKTLLAVVTPNAFDSDGKLDLDKRKMIEPRDAEIDAVVALGKLYADQKDFVAAASVPPLMHGRRHVGAQEDERLLWLAWENGKEMRDLGSYQKEPAKQAFDDLMTRAQKEFDSAKSSGRAMLALFPSLGPKFVQVYDKKDAKKGDWVFFRVQPTKLTDKELTFSDHDTYQVATECHDGTKVIAWNPSTGAPIWNTECTYHDEQENVDLKAALAQKPPAWTKDYDYPVWVVAKVDKLAGTKWTLSKAAIVDWRFLGVLGL